MFSGAIWMPEARRSGGEGLTRMQGYEDHKGATVSIVSVLRCMPMHPRTVVGVVMTLS